MHYRTTSVVREGLWDMRGDDAFFEQTGTPFLNSAGDLIHAPRVGVRADWDETDGSHTACESCSQCP